MPFLKGTDLIKPADLLTQQIRNIRLRSSYHCSIQTFTKNNKVQNVMLGTEPKRNKIFSLSSKNSYFRGDRYTNCCDPIKNLMYKNKETYWLKIKLKNKVEELMDDFR